MNRARGLEVKQLKLRGGNFEAYKCRDNEMICAGPSETGKTVAMCAKVHKMCLDHPKAQFAITRKTFASMRGTVLKTWAKLIDGFHVRTTGGTTPQLYTYTNGSQVWVLGLDHPERLLSGEFDGVYVNQAEELSESDWEMVGTRCTGRAGNVPYPQIFGDANPAGRMHWIPRRAKEQRLVLIPSRHVDNPSLYNDDGQVTVEGQKRLDRLSAVLTGIRRLRLLDGKWAAAEGAIYDMFDSTPGGLHLLVRDAGEFKHWLLTCDIGYTHPTAVLLVGVDEDGRWHIAKELYKSGLLPSAIVASVAEWFKQPFPGLEKCDYCVVDEAAAGVIADMEAAGVYVKPGKGKPGEILSEVGLLQDRLAKAGDGRPRLTVDPSCINTISEFESYAWDPKRVKEQPIKKDDHAMDALRYLAVVESEPSGSLESTEGISVGAATQGFTPRQFTPRFQIIEPRK